MPNQKISASLENYLEAIYDIANEKNEVKAIEISKKIGVGKSSVTEALKNLADKKLINYAPYDAITMTKKGEEIAGKIAYKHKVLCDFFEFILNVDKQTASENACRIEHVISEDVFEKLVLFIEFSKEFSHNDCNFLKKFKNYGGEKMTQ